MNDKTPSTEKRNLLADSPAPDVIKELAPTRARERTWRSAGGFTLLMLVVLGLSLWYIQLSDKRKEDPQQFEAETGGHTLLPPDRMLNDSYPEMAVPEVTLPPEIDAGNVRSILDSYDSDKMARAMGEVRIGTDYSREQDWDSAELHARRALEIWPEMNEAQRLLGFIFSQRGQFAQAAAILEKALESGPFSAETFNNLATAYMHGGQLDKAEDLFFTALQIRPDYYVANLNLGLLYLRQGRYDEAVDNLERGLEQMPDGIGPRNNLAVALFRLGRYEEARDHLQQIIDRHPGAAPAYFNIAISYVLEKEYASAMNWIKQGSTRCSPVTCQKYLQDGDFLPLRGYPDFDNFVSRLYPEMQRLPTVPGT